MSETEAMAPPNTLNYDPCSWLATQNKELRDHNNKLAKELYDWKLNASETNERLSRIYQNRNIQNYVDSFYDSTMKRLIKSLAQENVILKNESSFKDVSNSATKLLEQKNTIEVLKDKLVTRCQENKQLKNEMEILKCSDAITELKRTILDLHKTHLKITVENTALKNHMKKHNEIMTYLKSAFGKQRKEFIKIFTEHYLQDGDLFIEQLKSLDSGEIPEFLTKPLQNREILTNIDECIDPCVPVPTTNLIDSGIDSIPDMFGDLLTKCRELEEAKITIRDLEEEFRCKSKQDIETKTLLTDKNKGLEYRVMMLEGTFAKMQKELYEAKDDASSWKTALQQFCHNEMSHRQSYPFESDTQEYRKRITLNKVMEPHQTVKWCTPPQPVLVRDSPAKTSDSHYPTETQDISKYTPRGPLSFSPSVPEDISTCSTFIQEKKKSTENDSSDISSLERKSPFIQCEKCKEDIESNHFDEHGTHCGSSGTQNVSK